MKNSVHPNFVVLCYMLLNHSSLERKATQGNKYNSKMYDIYAYDECM